MSMTIEFEEKKKVQIELTVSDYEWLENWCNITYFTIEDLLRKIIKDYMDQCNTAIHEYRKK